VVGDPFEDVVEIDLGVESVELGRAEQRVDRGGTASASVGASEEIVLASESDSTDILPISVKN